MEQKEQTAVEWLQSEIKKLNISVDGATQVSTIRIFEQAKKMEEQQRKQSYDNGYANGQLDLITE